MLSNTKLGIPPIGYDVSSALRTRRNFFSRSYVIKIYV